MSQNSYQETLSKIKELQDQLEQQFDQLLSEKRAEFNYQLRKGKVIFEKSVHDFQKKYRTNVWSYIKSSHPLYILTAPIIYSVIIPLVLLDAFIFIYQQVCFRVYGIPMVSRTKYIIIDRHHLKYLNIIEKVNCVYCGYGNGLIEYIREVFARTEQFWCPIKHARRAQKTHIYAEKFADYGNAEIYQKKLESLRAELNKQNNK